MTYGEALGVIFPLLNGRDLGSCMQVCKQWRDIARDDYFWKCLCAKRWPSIFKRSTPPSVSYRELLQKFCRRYRGNLNIGPRFSFDDLEFYLDIWDIPVDEERLLFSEVIPGSVLGGGIRDLPPGFIEVHKLYLDSPGYKMLIPVEPKFCLLFEEVRVSLVVGRKDTNQLACIFEKFEYIIDQNSEDEIMVRFTRPVLGDGMKVLPPYDSEIDMSYFGRHGYKVIMPVQPRFSIDFTPPVPDFSDLIAWVSVLFMDNRFPDDLEYFVVGISLDFGESAECEYEVLSLLHLLDWD